MYNVVILIKLGYTTRDINSYMPACFDQVQQKNGQLDSFFLVFCWCFAVVCGAGGLCGGLPASSLVTLPIVPNSGGDLWWFAVMCGSVR